MAASPTIAERYREDGFVLLPGLFTAEALAGYEERFLALVAGEVSVPEKMVIMRDIMVARRAVEAPTPLHAVNKLLSFEDDPVLFRFAQEARLLDPVRQLIGHDVMTISTNVFNKPPGIDGRHPLHQDLRYFSLRPADKIVASWTAIAPCTRENGCLAIVPGSHRGGLRDHADPDWEYVNYGFFAAEGVDRDERVHMEMAPGDTLLFHPLLVHGSGRNRSEGFRRAISVHYASLDCSAPGRRSNREPVTRRI